MIGSRCASGHGDWLPARARCPVCAGAVETIDVPEAGVLLAATSVAGRAVGVVRLGEAVAPVVVAGAVAEDARVRVRTGADGLLVAEPADP